MQHGEGLPSEETRRKSERWSDDADRNVRGGTPARAGREAGDSCRDFGVISR